MMTLTFTERRVREECVVRDQEEMSHRSVKEEEPYFVTPGQPFTERVSPRETSSESVELFFFRSLISCWFS